MLPQHYERRTDRRGPHTTNYQLKYKDFTHFAIALIHLIVPTNDILSDLHITQSSKSVKLSYYVCSTKHNLYYTVPSQSAEF